MREMPTAKVETEDNQHNTECVTNKVTISFLCHNDGRGRWGKLEEEENKSFAYSIHSNYAGLMDTDGATFANRWGVRNLTARKFRGVSLG